MLGNQEDAEIAAQMGAQFWNDYLPRPYSSLCEYPGWEYIGKGETRVVFLSPDGIVYKSAAPGNSANADEYRFYSVLKPSERHNLRIAQCYLWETKCGDIIAMEYIPHEMTEFPSYEIDEYLLQFDIEDCWLGNFRVDDDGMIVLIDYSR